MVFLLSTQQTIAPTHPVSTHPQTSPSLSAGLNKSVAHFARPSGSDLLARTEPFLRWRAARIEADVYPYFRTLLSEPGTYCSVANEIGVCREGINFANTDYLSLSTHPAIREAAINAIHTYGAHNPSSPILQGNTGSSLELEATLSEWLQTEHVVLFPTGWAAGFGTITALVRPDDHIVMDNLAHACLQQGAQAATANIRRHTHLDLDEVVRHLQEIRATDTKNAILVISEGLFSMDSDYPDLKRLQGICREYEATLMVDVAHDLGAMGPDGTGVIGLQEMLGEIDLVMGAFSKSFGTNGGFVATHSQAAKYYIKTFGGTHLFSTAISPIQTSAALEAIRIIRSAEGQELRDRLMSNILMLRSEFKSWGIECLGDPTPIVPVPVGSEKVARIVSSLLFEAGVFANLVEFPVVAVGAARFRMQVMAGHTPEQLKTGAKTMKMAIEQAQEMLTSSGVAVVKALA